MRADPLFLTTAIEAVVRAGTQQLKALGSDIHIAKKGTIDLVTEVDLAIERMFRALIAERFPDHQVLAEEMGGSSTVPPGPCWVFDPIDGTTNFAHGLPIFCASLALEFGGVAEVAAIYDPTREELFTAERAGGAFLNGRPIHVSSAQTLVDAMLVTGFPYDVHQRVPEIVGLFGEFVGLRVCRLRHRQHQDHARQDSLCAHALPSFARWEGARGPPFLKKTPPLFTRGGSLLSVAKRVNCFPLRTAYTPKCAFCFVVDARRAGHFCP